MTRVRPPAMALAAFALLGVATVAAFFVTQRLKDSDPIVKRIMTPLWISPNGDGRKETAPIGFQLPKGDHVTVSIVTAGGDERRRLLDDRRLGRGQQQVIWDGRDDAGAVLPDGQYYVRVALRTQGRAVTGPPPCPPETRAAWRWAPGSTRSPRDRRRRGRSARSGSTRRAR